MEEDEDVQDLLEEVPDDNEDYVKVGKKNKMNKTEKSGMLKEAVSDLDKEINQIRKDKSALNSELKNLDDGLDNAEQIEKRLKNKIAALEMKETEMVSRKNKLKQKNDILSKKLTKVKSIKDQLSDI